MNPLDCAGQITQAAGRALSDDELIAIAERIQKRRKALEADGPQVDIEAALKQAATEEGEAALRRRAHDKRMAARNVIVRDKLDRQIDSFVDEGAALDDALRWTVEGTVKGYRGGRRSAGAHRVAYESRYQGAMVQRMQREVPHLLRDRARLLYNRDFNNDVVREMARPGSTGNATARTLAEIFADVAETARADLNRLGADIGKLDGWAGAQAHDPDRMIAAGQDAWVSEQMRRLDLERTFGDDLDRARDILAESWRTIVTGQRPGFAEIGTPGGQRQPANIARGLGKERVFHYRSPEDWIAYADQFSGRTLTAAMIQHFNGMARTAAQMEMFGPNPLFMIENVAARLRERARELSPKKAQTTLESLEINTGFSGTALGNAVAEMMGETSMPAGRRAAKIASDARMIQSLSKLGGAVISSVTDLATRAANLRFQGKGLFSTYSEMFVELMNGVGDTQQRELAATVGEGFDGALGHILTMAQDDLQPGMMAKLGDSFFRLSGLTWWTDAMRAGHARMQALYLGSLSGRSFEKLPEEMRHVLSLHDIGGAQWDAIRRAAFRQDGKTYLTPDQIAKLDGALVDPFIDAATLKRARGNADRLASLRDRARLDLELALRRFYADEMNFGMIETDEASRRFALQGTRPGTVVGEGLRFMMQFKGFPVAYTNRVMGRAFYGGKGGTRAGSGHIAHMLVATTVLGYGAMTAKDALRGYWPPRDPTDPKTILAAMVQGGGAGIFGDFLFGEANRFGGGAIATLAGPTAGEVDALITLLQRARSGEASAGDALNLALRNTPFANLWYLRPALEMAVLNELYETARPGYLRRQERRRRKDMGQERWLPTTL